jgi:peroxiredoxin
MSAAFVASYIVLWTLALLLSLLVLLLYRHFGLQAMGTFEGVSRTGLRIGEEAPPVSGNSLDGRGVTVWTKPIRSSLVVFGSSGCRPCEVVVPDLDFLARRVDAESIVVITQNDDDHAAFVKKYRPSFRTLSDAGVGTSRAYQVKVSPFAFVVGPSGRVLAKAVISDRQKLMNLLRTGGLDRWADALVTHPDGRTPPAGVDQLEVFAAPVEEQSQSLGR